MAANRQPTGVVRTSDTGPRPRVRLNGPGALAACLDQLVGFPPVESLVLLGMSRLPNGRSELVLTLRVDLGAVLTNRPGQPGDPGDPGDPADPAALAAVLVRNGCTQAHLVAVTEHSRPPTAAIGMMELLELDDQAARAVYATAAALAAARIGLVEALLVQDGRWWSYMCAREECCPAAGTPITTGDADLLRAEKAWAGEPDRTLASRDAVVRRVAAANGVQAMAVAAALHQGAGGPDLAQRSHHDAVQHAADLIDRFHTAEPAVTVTEWARLLTDLSDALVRDACLGAWRGKAGEAALDLWCTAARLAPAGFVAPPATMAGVVAHARGEGALAGEAFERALGDDPTYRLATYAMTLLTGGVPPRIVRQTMVGAAGTLRARGMSVLDGQGRVAAGKTRAVGRNRRRSA